MHPCAVLALTRMNMTLVLWFLKEALDWGIEMVLISNVWDYIQRENRLWHMTTWSMEEIARILMTSNSWYIGKGMTRKDLGHFWLCCIRIYPKSGTPTIECSLSQHCTALELHSLDRFTWNNSTCLLCDFPIGTL